MTKAETNISPPVEAVPSLSTSGLFRSQFIALVLANGANVLNYLASILCARLMSAESFGKYNAVISIGAIILTVCSVLPNYFAKLVVDFSAKISQLRSFIQTAFILSWVGGLLTAGLTFLVSGPVAHHLGLEQTQPILFFTLAIFTAFPFTALLGIYFGLGRYGAGNFHLFAAALVKCASILLVLVYLDLDYDVVVLSLCLPNIVGIIWMYFGAWPYFRVKSPMKELKGKWHSGLLFLLPMTTNTLLTIAFASIDIIIVKHFFSAESTGLYSSASTVAKIAYFLPLTLTSIVVPELTRNLLDVEKSKKIISQTFFIVACLNGSFLLVIYFFGSEIIGLTFGERYQSASEYLTLLCTAMTFIALVTIFSNALIAQGKYGSQFFLYGIFLTTVAISYGWLHESPQQIAWNLLGGSGLCVLVLLAFVVFPPRARNDRQKLTKA